MKLGCFDLKLGHGLTQDSDGQLELGEVPLVHVVVSHQLIAPGKLLLAVRPPAVKRLLACQRERGGGRCTGWRR